jgi:guanine deaminase
MRLRARVLSPGPTARSPLTWLDDALVAWDEEGVITEVAPWSGGPVDHDLRDGVLTPGFVDSHVHFPQTRIVGAASGPLLPWLQRSTFPEEQRFADRSHAEAVAAHFTRRLAAAGTTLSFVYSSVHETAADALFAALADRGLRAIAGPVLMDQGGPEPLMVPVAPAMAALDRLHARWHGHDDRLQLAVIPRFGLSCTREMMSTGAAFARKRGLWVSTHLSETLEECRVTTELFGTADYLEVYEQAGLVHDRSVYAHCIHLSDSEWDRFAEGGAIVAHCPDSNDFLGSGGMPLDAVDARDVRVTLGTDVAAGRTFRVPRIASSAHDNALRQGNRQPPSRWLFDGTRGGALAFGVEDCGVVAPGFSADLVCHHVPAWVEGVDEALGWILFHHDAPPASHTWVRGRSVWQRDLPS